MRENHAPILAVHPAVPLPMVVLLQRDAHRADQVQIVQVLAVHQVVHLHLHLHLRQGRLDQIAIAVVKIFRRAVVHPIVVEQRVKFRKVVKSVIHAGFVPSR